LAQVPFQEISLISCRFVSHPCAAMAAVAEAMCEAREEGTEEEHNSYQEDVFDRHSPLFAEPGRTPPDVEERLQRIARACRLTGETTILDVATGTGALLPYFEAQGACLRHVTGVDLSGGMLGFARERFPAATFVKEDVLKYTHPKGERFDRVVLNACFGNLWDQGLALQHVVEALLKDGGLIVISHPLGRKWLQDLQAQDPRMVRHPLPSRSDLQLLASRISPRLRVESFEEDDGFYCGVLQLKRPRE